MDEQVKVSQETSGPARKSRRTWLVMAVCVLVVAVGARVWYVRAASSYQEEQEALRAGFKKLELMATLPGVKLYERHGFVPGKPIHYPLGGSLTIEFVPMHKEI